MRMKKCIGMALVLVAAASLSCTAFRTHAPALDSQAERCLRYSLLQMRRTAGEVGDSRRFPGAAPDGRAWKTADMYDWRSGFFAGCLWYGYEFSKDVAVKELAVKWTESLEPVKDFTGSHDVGFMMFCSYGNGYRLTGNPAYRQVLLRTAQSLAKRYNPRVGLIQSWNSNDRWRYPVILDNMMNLELLFWAARNGGGPELRTIAETHALNTMKNHIRPDGSTFHVVDYDPRTGAVLARNTHQGYADSSTWSRGQAWGLYGFTMTFRETRNPKFLEAAVKIADYFIAHLPDDSIPFWDFQAPGIPNEPRDTSAAAIAASGLLELETLITDKKDRERYHRAALAILTSLCSPKYLTEGTGSSAVLRHATGSRPHGMDVDASLIYGDYYFMEALMRYRNGIGEGGKK